MAVVLKATEMKVSQGSNPWLSVLTKISAFLFSLGVGLGLIALVGLSVALLLMALLGAEATKQLFENCSSRISLIWHGSLVYQLIKVDYSTRSSNLKQP